MADTLRTPAPLYLAVGVRVRRHPLAVIVLVALLLRVVVIAGTADATPAYDGADYQRVAAHLAEEGSFPPTTFAAPGTPSAFRPPAWPYLVAGAYVVLGDDVVVGRLVGALIGTAAVWLLALVAIELVGRRRGLLAGAAAAAFPPLWFVDTALLSEPLFNACVLGMVWALLRARRAPRPAAWLAVAGVACGVGVLTRSQGLLLVIALVVAAWQAWPGRRAAAIALSAVVALAVVSPWVVRNRQAFGAFVPLTTQSGFTLAGTYNDAGVAAGAAAPSTPIGQVPALRPLFHRAGLAEPEVDRRLVRLARSSAFHHPRYVAAVLVLNSARLFTFGGPEQGWITRLSSTEMGVPSRIEGILSLMVTVEFWLALVGGVLLWRRGPRGPAWFWAIPVLLWASSIVVSGAPRYRTVLDPFLLVLAAVTAGAWLERRARAPRLEVAR